MIYYEVVVDVGDGYAASHKFRTYEEAEEYVEFVNNDDESDCSCMNGIDTIDTDKPGFYYESDEYEDE